MSPGPVEYQENILQPASIAPLTFPQGLREDLADNRDAQVIRRVLLYHGIWRVHMIKIHVICLQRYLSALIPDWWHLMNASFLPAFRS